MNDLMVGLCSWGAIYLAIWIGTYDMENGV